MLPENSEAISRRGISLSEHFCQNTPAKLNKRQKIMILRTMEMIADDFLRKIFLWFKGCGRQFFTTFFGEHMRKNRYFNHKSPRRDFHSVKRLD
jgi:hypothetical protein